MSDNRFDDYDYDTFEKHDIMDKIGDSFTSVFSRKSRNNYNSDDLLSEFSSKNSDDDYELFVDESVGRKTVRKSKNSAEKVKKPRSNSKSRAKKPVTPLMRKVRNIITYCSIVAVVLIVCIILSLTVLFKTQNYEVSGNTKYKEAEIIETCSIGNNENIFLANKRAAEKRLKKTYPYVEDADVSFAIPDTITISITEAVPSYMVKVSENEYLVTSSKGRILEKVKTQKGYDLPLFLGDSVKTDEVGGYIEYEDEKTLEIINEIVTVFNDNGYTGITEINATNTANISFTYDGRIKVKIGLPEDISYKVRTAMTIINEKLDPNGANATRGELDVAKCNETKKSYFREQSLIDAQKETTATENETTSDTGEVTDESGEDYESDSMTDDSLYSEDSEEPSEEATEKPLSQDDWYLD